MRLNGIRVRAIDCAASEYFNTRVADLVGRHVQQRSMTGAGIFDGAKICNRTLLYPVIWLGSHFIVCMVRGTSMFDQQEHSGNTSPILSDTDLFYLFMFALFFASDLF